MVLMRGRRLLVDALITNPLFGHDYLVPSVSCDAAATRFHKTALQSAQDASGNTDTTRQRWPLALSVAFSPLDAVS